MASGIKPKALSMDDKAKILLRYDELIGLKKKTAIAVQLGIPESKLRSIVNNWSRDSA